MVNSSIDLSLIDDLALVPKKRKKKGWQGQSGRHAKAARGIKTGRKKRNKIIGYKISSIEDIVKNYGSFPRIEEKLGKRKKEALMTKGGVTQFFRDYPEYRLQAHGLQKISLLEDRKPSMKIRKEAEFVPGMYLSDKKEIRLFPIEPKDIPLEYKERAKKFYSSKEQFPSVLPHELWHHAHPTPGLVEARKLSDKEILSLSKEKQERLRQLIDEEDLAAEKTEDIWLEKKRRRQRR